MKRLALFFLATLGIGIGAVAVAQTPSLKPVVVNQTGPYTDKGVWLYANAAGKYGYGAAVNGTNELLIMPAPSPSPGGSLAGILLIRHPFDPIGYPLHIALVEKLFAASYQTTVEASEGGDIWKHEFSDPVAVETPTTGGTRLPFRIFGDHSMPTRFRFSSHRSPRSTPRSSSLRAPSTQSATYRRRRKFSPTTECCSSTTATPSGSSSDRVSDRTKPRIWVVRRNSAATWYSATPKNKPPRRERPANSCNVSE